MSRFRGLLPLFYCDREALLRLAFWTIDRELRVPVARHAGVYLHAVLTRCGAALGCAAAVHLHAGHVHVELELDRANVDELTSSVPEFDSDVVVPFLELPVAGEKLCGEL